MGDLTDQDGLCTSCGHHPASHLRDGDTQDGRAGCVASYSTADDPEDATPHDLARCDCQVTREQLETEPSN